MSLYKLSKEDKAIVGEITLTGSKSISNRVLIIRALAREKFKIKHLAKAHDTVTLQRLLSNLNERILNAHNGGTTFRFLAVYATTLAKDHIVTGSRRMLERPIGVLVEALKKLGVRLSYLGRAGYPPLFIQSSSSTLRGGDLNILANVSSQFISALLMAAPCLEEGLRLHLQGTVVSKPYIEMTLSLMADFGIDSAWDREANTIWIAPQTYHPPEAYIVEADWSAASYYYAMAVLADEVHLQINGLSEHSIQGDSELVTMMRSFGITSVFNEKGVLLQKEQLPLTSFEYNFLGCPDLAQTLVVLCSALGINAQFHGLQTLKIKETDRVAALDHELNKLGCELTYSEGTIELKRGVQIIPNRVVVQTYEDHRMAMAFAPLALLGSTIFFDSKEVVNKSYPTFWDDLKTLGFSFSEVEY